MFDAVKNFFARLFGKKSTAVKPQIVPLNQGEAVSIDIQPDRIVINQSYFPLPTDISTLIGILGEPRVQLFDTKIDDKEFLERLHKGAAVTNRANYMWDELGIKCYTLDGVTIHTFGVELNHGFLEFPHIPQNLYKGRLTIGGEPWVGEINKGEDQDEILRQRYLGSFLLTGEYAEFDEPPQKFTESSYTGVEVQALKALNR